MKMKTRYKIIIVGIVLPTIVFGTHTSLMAQCGTLPVFMETPRMPNLWSCLEIWENQSDNSDAQETVSHVGEVVDYVSLIDNLRANDTTVNPEGEIEQPFFSVTGFSIQVNGSSVQVFEYNSAKDAEADASLVSSDASSIGTSMPFWIDDPHFYYKEKIIVLYVGDDPDIEELLESALGNQFAPSIDEPIINSFEECIAAGNPAMESYPRQCITKDKKHFVEELT